jgi:hypothetical protein
MSVESRRDFLTTAGTFLVSAVTLGSVAAYAAEEDAHMHGGSGDGLALDATSKNTCGTCQFRGWHAQDLRQQEGRARAKHGLVQHSG